MRLFPFDQRARKLTLSIELFLFCCLVLSLAFLVLREGLKNEKLPKLGSCLDTLGGDKRALATDMVLQRMYEYYFRVRVKGNFVFATEAFYKTLLMVSLSSPDWSMNLRELHAAFSLPCEASERENIFNSEIDMELVVLQTDYRREFSFYFLEKMGLAHHDLSRRDNNKRSSASVGNGTRRKETRLARTEQKFFQSFNPPSSVISLLDTRNYVLFHSYDGVNDQLDLAFGTKEKTLKEIKSEFKPEGGTRKEEEEETELLFVKADVRDFGDTCIRLVFFPNLASPDLQLIVVTSRKFCSFDEMSDDFAGYGLHEMFRGKTETEEEYNKEWFEVNASLPIIQQNTTLNLNLPLQFFKTIAMFYPGNPEDESDDGQFQKIFDCYEENKKLHVRDVVQTSSFHLQPHDLFLDLKPEKEEDEIILLPNLDLNTSSILYFLRRISSGEVLAFGRKE